MDMQNKQTHSHAIEQARKQYGFTNWWTNQTTDWLTNQPTVDRETIKDQYFLKTGTSLPKNVKLYTEHKTVGKIFKHFFNRAKQKQ